MGVASSPEAGRCNWPQYHYINEVRECGFGIPSLHDLHIKPDDFSLRVILVAIALASGIKKILNPEDVIEPSTWSVPCDFDQ